MQLSKESMVKARKDFALHLALIMREGMTKAEATIVAYAEGAEGLDARLPSPPILALMDHAKANAADKAFAKS